MTILNNFVTIFDEFTINSCVLIEEYTHFYRFFWERNPPIESAHTHLTYIGRVVHRDMDFHFCHQKVNGTVFSVQLSYLMVKNHNKSSRWQDLRKSHAYFVGRCGRHWWIPFLSNPTALIEIDHWMRSSRSWLIHCFD